MKFTAWTVPRPQCREKRPRWRLLVPLSQGDEVGYMARPRQLQFTGRNARPQKTAVTVLLRHKSYLFKF